MDPSRPSVWIKLAKGNVITVEPGLYFRENDRTVPARFRGFGIRIEDDVLVTSRSHEVLSKNCPKSVEEIESACAPRI